MFDDRLEVDSPGAFAGMVKKENIRYTHFSRNPKIAAFLKDYGYVKEYGEGVDRMCKELEAIGLPDPVYNNNTFILKTTVLSASFEHESTQNVRIGETNASIQARNARIEDENVRIGDENARIETENAWIGDKNARIETQNIWNRVKNDWIQYVRVLKEKGLMTNITAEAIIAVLEDIRDNQVSRTRDVQKNLDCKDTKALRIITEMKNYKIIVEIAGQGKGKYILNVND